jgi:hypothetical protein
VELFRFFKIRVRVKGLKAAGSIMFQRYIKITKKIHAVVNLCTCAVSEEVYEQVDINWGNVRRDIGAIARRGLSWLRDVAIASDVSLGALALSVSGVAA